jgi:ribonucleoside-diphosphate reductase alpha chain
MDYLFRWLGSKFIKADAEATVTNDYQIDASGDLKRVSEVVATGQSTKVEVIDATKSNGHANGNGHGTHANGNYNFIARTDAPTCPECGSIMIPNGSCHKCVNCGTTSGCS